MSARLVDLQRDLAAVEDARRCGASALLRAELSAEPLRDALRVPASSQVALQIHESCGHPIELDRVLGTEAAFAGMSFLTPEKLGTSCTDRRS